jgi:TolB protein
MNPSVAPRPVQHTLRHLITASALAVGLALGAGRAPGAQDTNKIVITRPTDSLGFMEPIPVNVSGFTGEADMVLKNDLLFMGVQHVPLDQAKFLVTGNNAGRVEGHVVEKTTKFHMFGKAYTGGTTRAQTHMFADDVTFLLTGKKGIAQTRMCFKAESGQAKSEIYVADYDGFNPQQVTRDQSIAAGPCWAGPGSQNMLVYSTYKLGNPNIFSHQLLTGARSPVARYPGGNYSPAVSPDGRRVAMILSKSGSPDLYVGNIDGTGLKQLTATREAEFSPCWSPDGRIICYGSRERGATLLFTISPNGGAPRQLATTGAGNPTEPDWSPDGRWIAFTSQARSFVICIVPANEGRGGEAIPLVEGEDPSWAPNSRTLLFCNGPDHAKHLSLLDVPKKQVKHVARILESNSQPSWAK